MVGRQSEITHHQPLMSDTSQISTNQQLKVPAPYPYLPSYEPSSILTIILPLQSDDPWRAPPRARRRAETGSCSSTSSSSSNTHQYRSSRFSPLTAIAKTPTFPLTTAVLFPTRQPPINSPDQRRLQLNHPQPTKITYRACATPRPERLTPTSDQRFRQQWQ
jgi:hypothetical protein